MKNLILTTTFIAAGTLAAFADAPTGTYEDGNGNTQSFNFNEQRDPFSGKIYAYSLNLDSGTYKNVLINSNDSIDPIDVRIGSGVTFEGFTFNGVKVGAFHDDGGSVLGGNIVFSNVVDSHIWGKLSSGTHFSIDSNSRIFFHSNIWDILSADLTKPLIDGEGRVGMSSTDTFTLNFRSEELLKEQTISLVSAGTLVVHAGVYSGFKEIAITLNGKVVSDYIATQSKDGKTISISRAVPEPSLFGLLAGTLALVLAGTRRRRRK